MKKALKTLDRTIIILCTIGIFAIPSSIEMNPSMTIGQAVTWSIVFFGVGLVCGCYGLEEILGYVSQTLYISFKTIKKCLSAVVKPNKHKIKYFNYRIHL